MADGAMQPAPPALSPELEALQTAFERRNRATRVRIKLLARLARVAAYEQKWQAALEAITARQIAAAKPARPAGR